MIAALENLNFNHMGSLIIWNTLLQSPAATISECPKGCRCTASDVIDCTGRNFTQPPIPIEDSKASDLLLEANRIAQIDLVFLKHYSSLRLLSLAGNGLR